ncbi:MAG: YdcF family protein [Pseudomonadota bacterium]|nr:YdcF family protein [Pseudomonadota bacterium]
MRRWDPALPLRAASQLVPAFRAVWEGARLPPGEGPADAIIVLGATVLPGGVASGSLRARAEAGAALFLAGAAPRIVTTGAHHLNPPGEAVVARAILLGKGVPEAAILVEDKSRNTQGNLLNTRGILPKEVVRVWIVTEPFHMARALSIARAVGFEPLAWPVDSPAWRRPASRLRHLVRDGVSYAFHRAGS